MRFSDPLQVVFEFLVPSPSKVDSVPNMHVTSPNFRSNVVLGSRKSRCRISIRLFKVFFLTRPRANFTQSGSLSMPMISPSAATKSSRAMGYRAVHVPMSSRLESRLDGNRALSISLTRPSSSVLKIHVIRAQVQLEFSQPVWLVVNLPFGFGVDTLHLSQHLIDSDRFVPELIEVELRRPENSSEILHHWRVAMHGLDSTVSDAAVKVDAEPVEDGHLGIEGIEADRARHQAVGVVGIVPDLNLEIRSPAVP